MPQDTVTSPSVGATSNIAHTPESVLELAGSELATSVFRTVNALLANPTDAEEVTLDTLEQLHKRLGEVGPDGLAAWIRALPAWLDKTAVTRAKGRTKKRRRYSEKLEELAHLHDQLADAPPKQATAKLVREILSYFPGRHRFCVVLHYGLGHSTAQTAELLAVEEATVTKSLGAVKAKLREFSAQAPFAGILLEGLSGAGSSNPLRDYMEHYGAPEDATAARLKRRFETYLREGADVELTGEYSFHDGSFSDSSRRLEALLEATKAASAGPPRPTSTGLSGEIVLNRSGSSTTAWIVAGVAIVALLFLGVAQYKMLKRLEALDQNLASLEIQTDVPHDHEGAALEPGTFVRLEHGSQAEPSKDARAKLLRSDANGAEFELEAGSISLHVKPVEGVVWIVHVGGYDVLALGTRFRVTHTEGLPKVEVFEGKVKVSGGVLGEDGVLVSSALRTLEAAMAAATPTSDTAVGTAGETGAGETETGAEAEAEDEELSALSSNELFARAMALRETNEAEAETLLWVVVERGEADEITEKAFEQLRSLVPAEARLGLSLTYSERFPDGRHAEDFAAMGCRATPEDERGGCWKTFREAYPDSLYGP